MSTKNYLKRKNYFIIMDKDEDHPNKPYFDVACFELTKDDTFYNVDYLLADEITLFISS